MSRSQINLQDAFLNHVRKEKIPVTINIAGGGKIDGFVKGFDNFVILLKHEGQHLIYKHAINTIVPERPVELAGHGVQSHAAQELVASNAGAAQEAPHATPDPADYGPETSAIPPSENEEPWIEG
jgi:host factor-I protein